MLPGQSNAIGHMRVEGPEALILRLVHVWSLRTMTTVMGRAFSIVSREHARNAAKGRPSRAGTAHTLALPWRARPLIQTFPSFLPFSQKPSTVRMSSVQPVSQAGFLVVIW